jgi:calcium-dependent protein kinase
VEVLLALRGTLNVANLEEVYENGSHVHLVLELCSGGELLARTTKSTRHYSERTAASYLRAVLRTVAQCHAKRVIHRDIKPENVRPAALSAAVLLHAVHCCACQVLHTWGSPQVAVILCSVSCCPLVECFQDFVYLLQFLFLSEDEASPIKAIDFGLAVFYDPQQLPLVGLNPEGTPW